MHAFEIPAITYAVFPVRPRNRLAWGPAIANAKGYAYTAWMPGSGYEPAGLIDDFEYHDERSTRRESAGDRPVRGHQTQGERLTAADRVAIACGPNRAQAGRARMSLKDFNRQVDALWATHFGCEPAAFDREGTTLLSARPPAW